jgi:hypothetical protein
VRNKEVKKYRHLFLSSSLNGRDGKPKRKPELCREMQNIGKAEFQKVWFI